MLDVLSNGFQKAADALKGKATLTEDNIQDALDTVKRSLLEADVEFGVTKKFLKEVKGKILGQEVDLRAGSKAGRMKVSAGDHFIKSCQDQLTELMGPAEHTLEFPSNRPGRVMMIGLQGVGKTTTVGKLAKYYMGKHKKKPLLVGADMYRPAAVEQLRVLGNKIGAPVFSIENGNPVDICTQAEKKAFELDCDLIIYDTAGRLAIDEALMGELKSIQGSVKPDHSLLVCDAMMGQDAVTTGKAFAEQIDISAFIMTKMDGDSRGGAALSMKAITEKPIAFVTMGEDLDKLELFRPEGLASRILGLGDVVGLMEDFERVSDQDQEEQAMKMLEGKFTFKDFYDQISMIQKMGSLKDIIAKLPMQNMIPKDVVVDDKELTKIKAMIDSMTKKERTIPDVINDSRAKRIANGSGRPVKEVQELIKKFKSMRTMMGNLGKNMGMLGKIPGMGSLSQLNQMRKMGSAMQGGGGMPNMGDLSAMMGGMPGMGGGSAKQPRKIDRSKLKKNRKTARNNRKKNRKK